MVSYQVWIAVILLIIGIVLAIIGIVLYERNVQNRVAQQWYVWALLIGGIILAIIGGIWLAFALTRPDTPAVVSVSSTTTPYVATPVTTAVATPVIATTM